MRLRAPRHPVERRAIALWTVRAVAVWGPVLAALSVAFALWNDARPWLIAPLALAVAGAVVAVGIAPWARHRIHRWEATDRAVYGLTGWLVREWRVAPISRIQTVDAIRDPVERMLGLATLRVTTASSKGAITIAGLDATAAAAVAEQLNAVAQETPGDAT